MPSRDVQILRQFTQKLAGQYKQANPLMDPQVLGMLGGGALTGLGAYGLARSMQSDEDRENGSMMPMLAGLAGAGAGAYGGSYLPQLIAALRAKGVGQQSISGVDDAEPQFIGDQPNAAMAQAQNMPAPTVVPTKATGLEVDYRPPGFKTPATPPAKATTAPAPKANTPVHDYRPPGFERK